MVTRNNKTQGNYRHLKSLLVSLYLMFSIAALSNNKNILIIHSYHQGLEWTDSITAGIKAAFVSYPEYQLFFEYVDTKRNNSEGYFLSVIELYRSKNSKIQYDAIITCDNAAYYFLLNHRDELFPDVPMFYCGVNFLDKLALQDHQNVYGFEEIADHRATLDLALELFPNRRNILIVNDLTLTGQNILKELQTVLPEYEDKLEFEILDYFSVDELKKRVTSLGNDYVIYLLVINKDRLGNYISYKNGMQIINENSSVPIFGSWDFYLGKGIIGGSITRGSEHGNTVAKQVIDYLIGKNTSPPSFQDGKSTVCLDYNVLSEYGMGKQKFDSTIQIINKPNSRALQLLLLKLAISILVLILVFNVVYVRIKKAQARRLEELVRVKTKQLTELNLNLEKINQSKNEILGIVAHDLRNPIGNVHGFSQIILEEDDNQKQLGKQSRESVEIIFDLSNYMLTLANNLLDFSSIETGVLNLNCIAQDYIKFIADEVTQNNALANKQGVRIDFESRVKHAMVVFDAHKMRQVFNNLFSNALKFSNKGGVISVLIESKGNNIITNVKDCGPGIPQDKYELIFGKFTQLHSPYNAKSRGAGLGLSIVKSIIEAHKGSVSVKSELNKGTEFIYVLPFSQ